MHPTDLIPYLALSFSVPRVDITLRIPTAPEKESTRSLQCLKKDDGAKQHQYGIVLLLFEIHVIIALV